ncbi:MAG: sulfatase-like hydrolase/transferase, partial [Acidimicrobiia bacterium]|nr:sulfatase-like hydrolase/transferase [Acidimicrobiia bacterium]
YADQHRADVMGCAGNDIVVTPHLDRLAAEGVRFDQAWTESPICQPARASMLTGRYPSDHGVLGNFAGDCQPEWDTFPRRLQEAGYTTASIGKTHFDSWPMLAEPGTPAPTDEWIGSFGFDHVVEEFDRYVHLGDWETPYMRFLSEHDALEPYREVIGANFRGGDGHWNGVTSPLPQELDLTCFLADEAQQWIGGQPGDRPWFLQLSFVQPHVPLMGDPIWADHYAGADIERTARSEPVATTDEWATQLAGLRKHSHSELLSDEFVLAGARQYYAMVSLIDQRIGDLLTQMERHDQLDNTWIVYSADHGEMLGDHGLMAKMNFYRSSVRVPLIVRPPAGTSGRVETAPVQAFDVAATLLDAGGATPLEGAPAQSLTPVVNGETDATREHAVSMIRMRPGLPTWQAITDGQWRATINADTGEASELFDLTADPDEATNLAADPSADDQLDRLRDQLTSTLAPT